ncbi:hypothetical protein TSOC_005862 [Tetrabaena socialis]|uniref:Uncharacterized protein n=1 Tax=Tetrabaena socialis TaxID=47790 RepID=A0A2J8A594_9CHLO|nr:hypothetical protein TSOC_005862 [Tetrabaena socialis]|eukprot:PNH07691.1 hypothetical protein TSOC_005862 [Tetrabaena socialis]
MAKPQATAVSPLEKLLMVVFGIVTGIVVGYCVMETAELVFAIGTDKHFAAQPQSPPSRITPPLAFRFRFALPSPFSSDPSASPFCASAFARARTTTACAAATASPACHRSNPELCSARPKEKEMAQGLRAGGAVPGGGLPDATRSLAARPSASMLAVAASSDCPPDRNTTPGTTRGTSSPYSGRHRFS